MSRLTLLAVVLSALTAGTCAGYILGKLIARLEHEILDLELTRQDSLWPPGSRPKI